MTSIRELLPAYALGALEREDADAVERALASDPALADELVALEEVAAALCDGLVEETPTAAVRARLLDSTVSGFARFAARFAELFDVTLERARDLLAMANSPSAWEPGPSPGSWLLHFEAGPAYAAADSGFVKLEPGMTFPRHRHQGVEQALVLQGQAVEPSGPWAPGDEPSAEAGTEHDFRAVSDEPLIFAVRVFGVDFDLP